MSILGMILLGGFVILAAIFLNKGPWDKESRRRQAYWDRYQGK